MTDSKKLYTPDLAETIKKGGDKHYGPSSSDEGERFMELFCEQCKRDQAYLAGEPDATGCPILAKTMCLDASDPDYPVEWTYDAEGQPVCTAFEQI